LIEDGRHVVTSLGHPILRLQWNIIFIEGAQGIFRTFEHQLAPEMRDMLLKLEYGPRHTFVASDPFHTPWTTGCLSVLPTSMPVKL
jgi:hypothetical protein